MGRILTITSLVGGLWLGLFGCKEDDPPAVPPLGTGDGGTSGSSGSSGSSGGANPGTPEAGTGDCPGAKLEPDPATVDALYRMFGSWQWEKERLNNNEADYANVCLKANGYLIGPEIPAQATHDYARCMIASEQPIIVRAGEYPVGQPCAAPGTGCGNVGMRMISARSGAIYALRPDGKGTTGNPSTYFLPIPGPTSGTIEIIESRGGNVETGNRMVRRAGPPNCP